MYQPKVKMDDKIEVPHREGDIIIKAIIAEEHPGLFECATKVCLNIKTFKREPQFVVASRNDGQHLSIWFNADPGMTMGGRAVEAGKGPNYYTTVGDLRKAIAAGIRTLDGEDDY